MIACQLHPAKYLRKHRVLRNIQLTTHSLKNHSFNNEWLVGKPTSNEYHTFYQQGKGYGGEKWSHAMHSWMDLKLSIWKKVHDYSITETQAFLTSSTAVQQHGIIQQRRKSSSQLHLFGFMITMGNTVAATSTMTMLWSYNAIQQLARHRVHHLHLNIQLIPQDYTFHLLLYLKYHYHPTLHLNHPSPHLK